MPFSRLTFKKISFSRNLQELEPLNQFQYSTKGTSFLRGEGALTGYNFSNRNNGGIEINLSFHDEGFPEEVKVKIYETQIGGVLHAECSVCGSFADRDKKCKHQWATLALLWYALAQDKAYTRHFESKIKEFCEAFQVILENNKQARAPASDPQALEDVTLASMSFCLDERSLGERKTLASYLPAFEETYLPHELEGKEDLRDASLWKLPQIFQRGPSLRNSYHWSDVKTQERVAGVLRYNFSNGSQVTSREILRHPLRFKVPKEFLPRPVTKLEFEERWTLLPDGNERFVTRDLEELDEVIQDLLHRVLTAHSSGELKLYLQDETNPGRALKLKKVSFEGNSDLEWHVRFSKNDSVVEASFDLRSNRAVEKYLFFESFALDIEHATVRAFAWKKENDLLVARLNKIKHQDGKQDTDQGLPHFTLRTIVEITKGLDYLRSRPLPVIVKGGTHRLGKDRSSLEIHLTDQGRFLPVHIFNTSADEQVIQKGFGFAAKMILRGLSQGLPYLLGREPKDLAARIGKKRDWDLKLLKHLGVLQYLTLEALSLHFEKRLSDGTVCEQEDIFDTLTTKVHALLISGDNNILSRDLPLLEMCSTGTLDAFEDYLEQFFKLMDEGEAYFGEQGEYLFEGVVERDFLVVFEILKQMAISSQGACFKKARTSLLSKMWSGNLDEDQGLIGGSYFFPSGSKDPISVSQTLAILQPLMDSGVKLFLNGQSLVELSEDEFKVDFQLVSNIEDGMLNWFDLNPRFFLQGEEINPEGMKNFGSGGVVEYNGRFFLVPKSQIPSLRRLEGFWQRLQKGKVEKSKKGWSDKVYQVSKNQALELLALRASGYNFRGDEEWNKLCSFYDSLGRREGLVKIPASVKGELKVYQHEGVQWLYDLYNLKMGALLADDMGLGKTLQTLSFLDLLRTQDQLGQALIVVPSSLVYNWESEIQKFTPDLPLQIFTSKDIEKVGVMLESKQPHVILTTYGLLMENEQFLSQYKWNILIFDEAQNLKNITTKRTSSARMLAARFKICLTGTPMENHYGEFFSLLDLVVPGSLGKYEDFRRQFVNTDIVLQEDVDDLKLKIKPLILRRSKKEILDQLPEKQETKVSIAFEERQKKIYRDIALAYNEKIQDTLKEVGESKVQLQMLTALLRLRQACSDPGALPQVKYDRTPPKLEALMESLEEIIESGESALVFTQFLQTLEHTQRILKAAGIPVFVLHGAIPTKQRQKLLKEFDDCPGGAVLVMTLKTGGVGLNLTKASYVFHLEPWWNPSVENQATDRAHRLGQKKAVQVFRYIMHESLEEKMEILKGRKNQKFQALFSESERATEADTETSAGTGGLSKDDFDFLLGLKD